MEKNILVSVIIPTYNRIAFVEEAIISVINQTYQNIEIIIVDDNANKPEIRKSIKNIVNKYPQCVLISNEKNLGGALCRNEGIKVANGELISFLDDDDFYEATRIEKVVEKFKLSKNMRVGIIYTFCNVWSENQKKVIRRFCIEPSSNPLFKHMCNCLCATSQWTIPKHVFNEVGMFEDALCKQDSIMLLKILGADYKALCVDECLSYFRDHDNERISENYHRHLVGEVNLLNWLRKYYHKLNTKQISIVEANASRRILYQYSGMRNYSLAFKEFINIIKNTGLLGLSLNDILLLFAPPKFYQYIKHKIEYIYNKINF